MLQNLTKGDGTQAEDKKGWRYSGLISETYCTTEDQ